jgi:Flp pilus assembly protein CpaB
MSNTFSTKVSGRVSSRGWAIALGLGAIVLATILLIVYLDRYRARVGGASAPTPVLVANRTIEAGTPGTIVAGQKMYTATTLPKKEVLEGAIADPTFLTGRAAAVQILPGKQITALDFAASTTTTVDSQITGTERGISVNLDSVHGSLSQLKAGDDIDIYVGTTQTNPRTNVEEAVVKLFRPNIRVLAVPTLEGGNLVLRLHTRDAARFAFANDHTRLWFVLRPAAGAKPTPNTLASAGNLTEGLPRLRGR